MADAIVEAVTFLRTLPGSWRRRRVRSALTEAGDTGLISWQDQTMKRTQFSLAARARRALKNRAREQGVSMAELLRRLVAGFLAGSRAMAAFPKEEIQAFVALGRSERAETSERHDAVLDKAFRSRRPR
jgi:hypothetical protein